MKKLLSLGLVLLALLTTIVPTPTYAAASPMYDTVTKVASAKLSGVYYYDLSIQGTKLIATGKYARREDPSKHTVQLQLTKPVTTSWYIGTDGLARVETYSNVIKNGPSWELKTTLTGVRNTSIAGDKKISMEVDLSGLADGIYNLHESITKNGKREGSFGSYLFVVVNKGSISLQTIGIGIFADLTQWYHDTGFWIN